MTAVPSHHIVSLTGSEVPSQLSNTTPRFIESPPGINRSSGKGSNSLSTIPTINISSRPPALLGSLSRSQRPGNILRVLLRRQVLVSSAYCIEWPAAFRAAAANRVPMLSVVSSLVTCNKRPFCIVRDVFYSELRTQLHYTY